MKRFVSLLLGIYVYITLLSPSKAITDRLNSRNQLKGWGQLGNIIRSESDEMYDGLGHSVSSSDDGKIVAMGAPYRNGNAGEVLVQKYNKVDRRWERMGRTLQGRSHGDYFGFDVALDAAGKTMVVSSRSANEGTGYVTVYRYDYTDQKWEQVGDKIDGKSEGEAFGYAVAMSETGNHIAIGAPYADDRPGRVEVYRYGNERWILLGSAIEGETVGDEAGETIDILEHGPDVFVAVGSPMDLDTEGTATVFKFQNHFGDWELMGRYVDGDVVGTDFGRSVSLGHDGTNVILAVGFPGPGIDASSDPLSGVQVYNIDPDYNWDYQGDMIFPVQLNDNTGDKVSLSKDGQTLAITSPNYDDSQGLVTVYRWNGKKYEKFGDQVIGDDYEYLGFSVSMSRDGTVVTIGSLVGRYVVSYTSGPSSPSASRSALGIIFLTLFVFTLVVVSVYTIHWGITYVKQRGLFASVPQHNEESGIQTMTFPVHSPQATATNVTAEYEDDDDDDDDDDDEGVSYADDDIDYETHLRQIT